MIDYTKASVDDVPMTIHQMMFNKANWDYAALLIAHGEISAADIERIKKECPEFYLKHVETGRGKYAH